MSSPDTPRTRDTPSERASRRRLGLGSQILLGMAAGAAVGAVLGERVSLVEPVGDAFIRLLMLAAIPLIFFNLLAGLTTLTDVRTFGRLAGKIVTWFAATSVVALLLGVGAMTLLRPGVGMTLRQPVEGEVGTAPSVAEVLLDLIPENLFRAFVEGDVTQLVVVSILLGIATLLVEEGPRDRLRSAFSDLAELFRKLVDLILIVAPYGIGALMAVTVGRYGAELFGPMAVFVGGIWGAHLMMVVLYLTVLRLWTARRPLAFLRETGTIWATTAATTSSLASLSVALDKAEDMELPRTVYGFTLPLGAQINKDGTAIMLVSVVLFTAQAANLPLAGAEFLTLLLMGFLLSAGSGGIPGGGFVVALILVESFGLPLELAAIVGGIYRLIDMGNTTVNVMGDLVGTVLVADSEARAGRGGAPALQVPASEPGSAVDGSAKR